MKRLSTLPRFARSLQSMLALAILLVALTASGLAAPVINSLSPSSGGAGTQVTISGNNFGSSQSTSTVTFNGTVAAARGRLAVSWSNTSIVVNVPSGATTGNVVVTVAGAASNGVLFTIAPSITSLSPTLGSVGTAVTITGTNFGATQGTSTVAFNGTAATPTSWSNTSIAVSVPSGATTGNVVVTVNSAASNGVNFTVTPVISSISPTSGSAGTVVTITGTNFGATQGSSTVVFNGTAATPSSWSATSISVPVPNGATTGNIVVTVGGNASNGVSFTVTLGIASRSPGFGPVGTTVTINGSGFGPSQSGSTVTFNGTATTPTTWNAGTIVAPVPTGATSGNVVVTVSSTSSNPKNFTVTPSPSNPAPTMTFTVNTTADTVDATPGDSLCADANGNCSLRAAVMESNASLASGITKSVTISIPAGTYTLTIPGIDGADASHGHLDINAGPVSIVGAGAATTIIQAGTAVNAQGIPNGIDKVFSINPGGAFAGFSASFSNLTIRYGLNVSTLNPFGGAFDWDAGTDGAGSLSITNCNILNNATVITNNTLTTLADGGGVALTNEVPNPAVEGSITISNSLIQGNIAQDTGGGIFEGSFPMQVSNTTIQNNQAVDNPSVQGIGQTGGQQTGGGMSIAGPTVGPQTVIQSSTISNNTAGQQGGGIFTTAGIQVTSDVFSGNHAGSTGAGLFSNPLNETTQVSGTNITQNVAGGDGGGVQVDNSNGNVFKMSFSRIVGNSGVHGSGVNNISGAVTATDNWWGCNQGPGNTGCDGINNIATAAFTPFLTLSNTPSPATIIAAQTSTLTASFLQDSANTTFAPGSQNMSAFNGLPVSFQNAIDGTLSNCQTVIQSNGTATCTFTGSVAGSASADAVVDQATATAHLQVQDFSLTLTPTTQGVVLGNSVTYTLTATPLNGFTGTVSITNCTISPAGPVLSGCPSSLTITGGAVTAQLSVATSTSNTAQNYTISVTGSIAGLQRSASATLQAQDFSVAVSPSTQNVVVTQSANYTVTVSPVNSFTGTVNISCPAGVTGCPSSVNITSGPVSFTATAPTTTSTPAQAFSLSFKGTSAASTGLSHTALATLNVQDFTVSVSAAQTVNVGSTGTVSYTVTVTALNGFNATVSLSCTNPPGIQCTFTPASVTGSGTSTMKVTIPSSPGTTTIQVTGSTPVPGTSNTLSHSANASLTVADFALSMSPSSITVNPGQSAVYTVTCSTSTGFNGAVQLSTSFSGGVFTNNPLNCPGQTQLTVSQSSAGTFNVPVSGTFGAATRNTSASLNVTLPPQKATGFVTISGTDSVCPQSSAFDFGFVTISINGQGATANYGNSGAAPTSASDLATALASAINSTPATSSLVTASPSGTQVNITANITGSAGDYSLSVSAHTQFPQCNQSAFAGSFTSGATLTGGQ